ncbi:hypothetical protein EYR36_010029 [Pleurotus pulmonarius]|nr:hypothetical protein EYR36_010029 [Pleurotus pulmonarius]
MMSVALEFGNSEECFRFIEHDFHKLYHRDVVPNENDDARTVIDDVCATVAPVALDYRHAELAAMRRGLSYEDFNDEFTEPTTQVTRRRASPADNHARPCVLIVHLEVVAWVPHDDLQSRIVWVHWTATDNPRACPYSSKPFQYLNNLHLSFASTASSARSDDSSSPPHSGAINIIISAQGISVLDGLSSVSTRNGLTINGANRAISINHISAIMGDYFGIINGGNVGGTNNTNYAHSYSR